MRFLVTTLLTHLLREKVLASHVPCAASSSWIGRNGSGQAVLSAPRLGLWAGLRGAGATGALRGLVL
jgi:hypothetical protein